MIDIRSQLRQRVPFSWRVNLRRAPAVVRSFWRSPRCKKASTGSFGHCQWRHQSPLCRQSTSYDTAIQLAKEHNIRLVAERLDAMVIEPGQTFSWHREVGPPLRWRGFQDGPEMHDGRMTTGRGGGICQVANMFFWLGLHAGLVVVERHRHGFDLFPDEERTVPFGCGATVFFPTLDLKMANTDQLPVLFRLWIEAGGLHGEVRFPSQPSERWSIVEEGHRFFSQEGTLFRENEIFRVVDDGSTAQRELLAKNRAVVCYTVDGQKKTQ